MVEPGQGTTSEVLFARVKIAPGHTPRDDQGEYRDPSDANFMYVLLQDSEGTNQTALMRQSRL